LPLERRYDLSDRPARGSIMSRGKPLKEGVRVKLPSGVTWEQFSKLAPEEIKERGLFPAGFLPLPHPNHPEGGMVFPKLRSKRSRSRRGAT
jgi:cytochrome c peroxidase